MAQTKGLPGVSLAFLAVAPLCLGSELPEAKGCSGGESYYGGPWAPCTVLAQSPRSLGPPWPCEGVLGAGLGLTGVWGLLVGPHLSTMLCQVVTSGPLCREDLHTHRFPGRPMASDWGSCLPGCSLSPQPAPIRPLEPLSPEVA